MDDPQVPKRLDEAITMVGTCMDICPRFERYRRERKNNLFNWEVFSSLPAVSFEPRAHVHTRPYHRDSFIETLGDLRVVHLALCYSLLSLSFAGPNKLE